MINWEPAGGGARRRHAMGQAAEKKLIGTYSEPDGRTHISPTPRTAAKVYTAAIGNQTCFRFRARCAEHQGVIPEVRMDVAKRRQERLKELKAGTVRLLQRQLAPKIAPCRDHVRQRRNASLLLTIRISLRSRSA